MSLLRETSSKTNGGDIVMNVKEVPVDSLVVPEYCKREHSQEQIDRFIRDLKIHKQYQPIVVSGKEILCGVLIWTAIKASGKETCFVNDLGVLPLEKKKEIRYLDNQIFDIEGWNRESMKRFLMDLDCVDLDKFGFSEEEASIIINETNIELNPGKPIKWKDQWECPNCGWKGTI